MLLMRPLSGGLRGVGRQGGRRCRAGERPGGRRASTRLPRCRSSSRRRDRRSSPRSRSRKRPPQLVATEEPVERVLCPESVLGVSGDEEGGELGLDEGRCVERLLVPLAGGGLGSLASAVPCEPKCSFGESRLVAEPVKRFQAGLGQLVPAERRAADDQRVRQAGVVVGQAVLEPAPVLAGVRGVGGCKLVSTRSRTFRASRSRRSGSR